MCELKFRFIIFNQKSIFQKLLELRELILLVHHQWPVHGRRGAERRDGVFGQSLQDVVRNESAHPVNKNSGALKQDERRRFKLVYS